MNVNWQGYPYTGWLTATVGANGAGTVSIDQGTTGAMWRIEQCTCYTQAFPPVLMALSRGINEQPTQLICSTTDFVSASVAGTFTASSAVADGMPYVFLQQGESLIASVFGGTPGDTFGVVYQYTLGTLY